MTAVPTSFNGLLQPDNVALVVLDHQDSLLASLPLPARETLAARTTALARTATSCGMPTLLTRLQGDPFQGDVPGYLLELVPEHAVIGRTQINCWDERRFVDWIKETHGERLLFAGLCTETAVSLAALSALELGYQVFLVTDATAGGSPEAHRVAIQRMIQAGVVPVTWRQVLFELYRSSGGPDGPLSPALMDVVRDRDLRLAP